MKTILLTNDDGFYSQGIIALKTELEKKYRVWVVAPDREKSAISMALTLNHPLRISQVEENVYAVNGTTADCVNIAMQKILPTRPDFIVSGMNLGGKPFGRYLFPGQWAVPFPVTCTAFPPWPVSLLAGLGQYQKQNFEFALGAEISAKVLEKLIAFPHNGVIYNLNIPFPNHGEIAATLLGNKRYTPDIIERTDPRGRKYYWIGTGTPAYSRTAKATDVWAVQNGLFP